MEKSAADLQAEVDKLNAQIAMMKRKGVVSFLGETLSADLLPALGTGKKLTDAAIKSKNLKLGYIGDGGNLWLQVTNKGCSWIFRYRYQGRQREMGLGSLKEVGLAEARGRALICRRLVRQGVDPIAKKREEDSARATTAAKNVTFKEAATIYIKSKSAGWKSPKQAPQWTSSLESYAFEFIGKVPVREIDTAMVMKVLDPIWTEVPETASRIRGRIESILEWAKGREYRSGENPARWKGHLEHQLAQRAKVKAVEHFPALPYTQIADFWAELCGRDGMAVKALRFLILTGVRSGDVRGATWGEIDLKEKIWTIPQRRLKASKRDHVVPLSAPAIKILDQMVQMYEGKPPQSAFVFPAPKMGALSDMTISAVLRRMNDPIKKWVDPKQDDRAIVPHGFRSTFRDWGSETTTFSNEVLEMALAHTIGSRVEASYRRDVLLPLRTKLMAEWGQYVTGKNEVLAGQGEAAEVAEAADDAA